MQLVTSSTWWVNILYCMLNVVLFPMIGLYCLYVGFYGVMKRPRVTFHLYYFWGVQGILCFLWFLFSIWPVGPWNGWTKAIVLTNDEGNDGFAIFLTIVESIIHTIMFILGICLIVASVLHKNKPPTDTAAMEAGQGTEQEIDANQL